MKVAHLNDWERGCYLFETKILNVGGYIPLVSNLTATGRIVFGKALILASIVFTAIFAYKAFTKTGAKAEKYQELAKRSALLAAHGVFNIVRGTIELFLLGGLLVCVPYDFFLQKRFCYPDDDKKIDFPWNKRWLAL